MGPLILAVTAAAIATVAQAETSSMRLVTNPEWTRTPTAEEFEQHYPKVAQDRGLAGRALVACKVTADGALTDCRIEDEEPADAGFGAAAVAIVSNYLRMRATAKDGSAVAGGEVRVPLRFVLPEGWITTPDWARRPSGELIGSVIPKRAQDERISGSATIACRVDLKGRLRDCVVEHETPEGIGFGAAALRMASAFVMHPKTVDGKPVEGRVRVPIEFKLPR